MRLVKNILFRIKRRKLKNKNYIRIRRDAAALVLESIPADGDHTNVEEWDVINKYDSEGKSYVETEKQVSLFEQKQAEFINSGRYVPYVEPNYLVYLDDAGNSGLQLGVFTDREDALTMFDEKVAEYQKEWDEVKHEVSRVDNNNHKEVFWQQPGFGQTWHFREVPPNQIVDIW